MKRTTKTERSSGNVFADIGVANPEQALAKAELARQINKMIFERKLSQVEAGALLGIDQPRVSALSTGRLAVFSLEKMMQFAARLGNEVEISIKPSLDIGIRVAGPPPHTVGQHVLYDAVIGGEDVQLSLILDSQVYDRRRPIEMDRSDVIAIPGGATFPVAA
jgi:predicted XRE-type DNA-binding protein